MTTMTWTNDNLQTPTLKEKEGGGKKKNNTHLTTEGIIRKRDFLGLSIYNINRCVNHVWSFQKLTDVP